MKYQIIEQDFKTGKTQPVKGAGDSESKDSAIRRFEARIWYWENVKKCLVSVEEGLFVAEARRTHMERTRFWISESQ